MAKRLMFHAAPAALVVALAAGAAAAQIGAAKPALTITASPDASRTVAGKTVLTFSATVLQTGHQYRVELGSLWSSEWKSPGTGVHVVTLPFAAKYPVPSSAKPGEQLCFALTRRTGLSSTAVATKCRTVAAPSVTAGTQPAPSAGAAPPARTPHVSAAHQPARTARGRASLPAGPPPDLTVAYEKTPVAKWIVRNVGQGPAPATVLRLSRAGLPNMDIAVVALAAGARVDIVVTPDLDAYLINASAKVDPQDQVEESDDANNTWQSAQSR